MPRPDLKYRYANHTRSQDTSSGENKLLLDELNSYGLKGIKELKIKLWETNTLMRVLSLYDGNITQAAKACGVDRANFSKRLRKLGIKRSSSHKFWKRCEKAGCPNESSLGQIYCSVECAPQGKRWEELGDE